MTFTLAALSRLLVAVIALSAARHTLGQEVIPDFYREPGLQPTRDYVSQHFSEHIDPFTGALQLHYVDLFLPGNGGFDLRVVRSYNSASVDPTNPSSFESLAGLGWTIHFGRVLKTKVTSVCINTNAQSVADNPVLELPDGSRQLLAFTGGLSPLLLTNQRWRADCITSGSGGLAVYSPDGTRYDMTQLVNVGTALNPIYAWYTTRITDRNGNFATVAYVGSASPEISSLSASDGRLISFSYLDSGLLSRRISSISASGGQTFTYSYQSVPNTTKYFLATVTRPDSTTWQYAYNGATSNGSGSYAMRQLRYPLGGTIDYAYAWVYFDAQANPMYRTSAVTGKTVSSGGTWTFAYSPGAPGVYDTTIVSTPAGSITYRHVGPNYSSSGTVWMVGLLMSKTVGSVQTENYAWGKQKISSENYFRPGQFVTKVDTGETNAPVLLQRQIQRDGATYATSYSAFDGYGNAGSIGESGPNGGLRTTTLTYYVDPSKWIIRQVKDESFSGSTITRTFDANGNLQSETHNGITTSYTHDSQGNISSATFPRSLFHSYSSHKRGIAQFESQPESVNIARTVSDAGTVLSETNGEGRTTSYAYDGLNRLRSIIYPAGNAVSITYTATSKTATRGVLTESTVYDGFGQPTSVTLGGISRTYAWDALGRMTFASNPGASIGTTYSYDLLNRLTRATNSDTTSRAVAYGAASMTTTDERGKAAVATYRAYGDPDRKFLLNLQAAEPTASIAIQRNSVDLVTSVAQGGVTRTYGYNTNHYLTSVTNPETGVTTYGRDEAGNMTSRVVGASGASLFAYDGQNRLTSAIYPGATPSVTKSYSRTNKLKSVGSSTATRTFAYDANDNLQTEAISIDGYNFNIGYVYNANDQLASLIYPRTSTVVNYTPDVLGRPTQVSGYVPSISYWPSGQIAQMTYGNGTTTSYQQNARLWPSSFRVQTASSVYANSTYQYDGVGNLVSINDTADATANRTLGYDGVNRLVSAGGPWGSGSITYTGTGNITSQTFGSSTLSYAYDGNHRLSNVLGARNASYGYDAYGNVISAGAVSYSYDGAPNLRCANCSTPATKVDYGYDGLNQRVVTTKAGVKTYEIYAFNGNLLTEYAPSQRNLLVEYIYLGGKRVAQRRTSDPVAATTTNLSASLNPAVINQPVTLTATISGNNPTGLVVFKDGANTLGSAVVSSNRATLNTSFATTGLHLLTANYGGDSNNGASSSAPLSMSVTLRATTTTRLSVLPNPALLNEPVTLSATVSGSVPSGLVTFSDGATVLGSASIGPSGLASFNAIFGVLGAHSISAAYPGDAYNNASISSAVSLSLINVVTTTTVINPLPSGITNRTCVVISSVISGSSPTGTAKLIAPNKKIQRVVSVSPQGTATFPSDRYSAGTYSIRVEYSGDARNSPSAGTLTVTIPQSSLIGIDPPCTNSGSPPVATSPALSR